jgi:hypothetical protein
MKQARGHNTKDGGRKGNLNCIEIIYTNKIRVVEKISISQSSNVLLHTCVRLLLQSDPTRKNLCYPCVKLIYISGNIITS